MYEEDDLLPISALHHLAFCERRWALIHLEQQWRENVLTVEGKQMHDRVHD
ncbi:MAG TPA: Dna2/Cas4 domain-containing protein, partial [Synergistaceae bacterium]|nr:Dna2/Cas4 domain-containing protein [Synergistaceae bacterium]